MRLYVASFSVSQFVRLVDTKSFSLPMAFRTIAVCTVLLLAVAVVGDKHNEHHKAATHHATKQHHKEEEKHHSASHHEKKSEGHHEAARHNDKHEETHLRHGHVLTASSNANDIKLSPDVATGIVLGLFLVSVLVFALSMMDNISANDQLGYNKPELYAGASS